MISKQRLQKIIISIITIILIPICLELIFGVKNKRLRIEVAAEEIVFNPYPCIFFNIDTLKKGHNPVEDILFSNENNFKQVSAITLIVSNRGKKSIDKLSYDNNVPITITFENSEFACKPYLWSETCAIPISQLKITYPNILILPQTILNHNDCYYIKVLLITSNHYSTPKISISGQISNQKRIKLKINKDVHFFNDKKENYLLKPEAEYLLDQNWEECTTL